MSERLTQALLAAAVVLLIAVQAKTKPGFDRHNIQAVAEQLGAPNRWVERKAPDFTLPLRDGSTFRLAEHVGREVVVLNFFATWCVPCRDEMPELQRFAAEMESDSKRVLVVGIDAEERAEQVDAFLQRYGVNFPAGIDQVGSIAAAYGVDAFPTTVVIGADGRIKLYQAGAISNADVALSGAVDSEVGRLGAPPPPARSGFAPAADSADAMGLTGRALAIAEAMPCPCGCDDRRVISCDCRTAKAIKEKLRAGVDGSLSDGKVMESLNKEFCMKGM